MLIQVDAEPKKIQVVEGASHPEFGLFGEHRCVLCGSTLHGHGWRRRWLIDGTGNARQYWIHRLRCSECRQTYTLIPRWMHAFKLYGLDVVEAVLSHRLEAGRFDYRSQVPVYLQKVWWSQFKARCMVHASFWGKAWLGETIAIGMPYVASRLSMNASADNGTIRVMKSRLHDRHHPLHLFVLPSG